MKDSSAPKKPPILGSRAPDGRFQFFQPRDVDAFFEGRDAHAVGDPASALGALFVLKNAAG